jgi:transcriptional regulator with XRE-family HTH domain
MAKEQISQRELADRTGINKNVLSRYFSGQGAPSLATIETIAETLGIPSESLVTEGAQQNSYSLEKEIEQILEKKAEEVFGKYAKAPQGDFKAVEPLNSLEHEYQKIIHDYFLSGWEHKIEHLIEPLRERHERLTAKENEKKKSKGEAG